VDTFTVRKYVVGAGDVGVGGVGAGLNCIGDSDIIILLL